MPRPGSSRKEGERGRGSGHLCRGELGQQGVWILTCAGFLPPGLTPPPFAPPVPTPWAISTGSACPVTWWATAPTSVRPSATTRTSSCWSAKVGPACRPASRWVLGSGAGRHTRRRGVGGLRAYFRTATGPAQPVVPAAGSGATGSLLSLAHTVFYIPYGLQMITSGLCQ